MAKDKYYGKTLRKNFARHEEVMAMPNLLEIQKKSYKWFLETGLREVFADVASITDYAGNLELSFIDYSMDEKPKYDVEECKARDATYAAPVKVRVRLHNKETGEIKEQEIFMGDFPKMTHAATFIINGAERAIVSQLVRSPGVYYGKELDKTDKVLAKKLSECEKAVIPGFYGIGADGRVKTFSRGGSDITGSIVAKACHASLYENWTDVSGCLVADPRIIDNPQPIHVITYRELRELSYMGATVLHEDAIYPARIADIPINIRNTNDPEAEGTLIVESTCQKPEYTITGIAGKKGFVAVSIDKDMMNSEVGFCRKALQAFEENGISIEHMPSGIDTMTVFVHQEEFEGKEQQVISSIRRLTHPDVIDLEADLGLIAVVGRGMKSTRGTAGRIFSALAHANINVKMIDQGSSELNIIIGVSNDDFEAAIKAIYDIFVETRL